jgi:hypothetical protein
MRYITNANSQIIGADESFLEKLGVDDIAQIYHKIAQNDIVFDYLDNQLELKVLGSSESYEVTKTSLSSLLGDICLVELRAIEESSKEIPLDTTSDDISIDSIEKDSLLLDDEITLDEDIEISEDVIITEDKEDSVDDVLIVDDAIDMSEESLFADDILKESEEKETLVEESKDVVEDSSDDDMFNLLLTSDDDAPLISLEQEEDEVEVKSEEEIMDLLTPEVTPEVSKEEVVSEEEDSLELDTTPIILDAEELSSVIGLSAQDYKSFFDEYIQTANSLKADIESGDDSKKNSAVQTLKDLSNVLHIPSVGDILSDLEHSDSLTTPILVESLYNIIDRLEVQVDSNQTQEESTPKVEETPVAEVVVEEPKESTSGHKIDLSDIKPIHFDFSMETAANELSLPVDLIEEFVNDFIEQAHEETEKMLTAYDEGDLDRVNKIGHLLKGTSSNLRITPLADTLYKIQFCENLDELEPLIKDYWGHFIAFETHIKMRTN